MFVLVDYERWVAYTYNSEEELVNLVKKYRGDVMSADELAEFLESVKGNPDYISMREFMCELGFDIFEVKND